MPTHEPAQQPDPGRARTHRLPLRERLSAAVSARVRSYRRRSLGWRVTAPLMFVVAGALFVTSAVTSGGTDIRAGRYDDLPGLAKSEAEQVQRLREQQRQLTLDVDDLTVALGDSGVERAQAAAEAAAAPAGMAAVHGPGLTVTLDDAPDAVVDSLDPDIDVDNLVVHEQDIQAVVNALWAGGAEAMTIQGQRVVSTTGVRCVGNTVVLHDVPYAPPYVISAIGNPGTMQRSLDSSPYVGFYLEAVAAFQLGWDVQVEDDVSAPAYDGPTELRFARPVRPPASDPTDPT